MPVDFDATSNSTSTGLDGRYLNGASNPAAARIKLTISTSAAVAQAPPGELAVEELAAIAVDTSGAGERFRNGSINFNTALVEATACIPSPSPELCRAIQACLLVIVATAPPPVDPVTPAESRQAEPDTLLQEASETPESPGPHAFPDTDAGYVGAAIAAFTKNSSWHPLPSGRPFRRAAGPAPEPPPPEPRQRKPSGEAPPAHQANVEPARAREQPGEHGALPPPPEPPSAAEAPGEDRPGPGEHHRPVIVVRAGILPALADQMEAALIRAGSPIYQRGGQLVRPVVMHAPAAPTAGNSRSTATPALTRLTLPAIVDFAAKAAEWQRWSERERNTLPANPPQQVAAILDSRVGMWKFSSIRGVICTPTLRYDGSILSEPGYDPATALFMIRDPDLVMPAIKEEPSKEDAQDALQVLQGLLAEFTFEADSDSQLAMPDRAAAFSALMTATLRPTMAVAPLHAVTAPTPSSGKTFIVDLSSAIATGDVAPVASADKDPSETDKRLVALMIASYPVILLDNVSTELGSDLLAQAVERPRLRLRPLGKSEIVEVSNTPAMFATGINLRGRADMVRRVIRVGIDTGMERPELRVFEQDPLAEILQDRGKFVAAILTISRAYLRSGAKLGLPPVASFRDWCRLVREPLVWLGAADPAETMSRVRADDPVLDAIRRFTTTIYAALGENNRFSASWLAAEAEATSAVSGNPAAYDEMRAMLVEMFGERGKINSYRLRNWLAQNAGRPVDGLAIERTGQTAHGGGLEYRVRRAAG